MNFPIPYLSTRSSPLSLLSCLDLSSTTPPASPFTLSTLPFLPSFYSLRAHLSLVPERSLWRVPSCTGRSLAHLDPERHLSEVISHRSSNQSELLALDRLSSGYPDQTNDRSAIEKDDRRRQSALRARKEEVETEGGEMETPTHDPPRPRTVPRPHSPADPPGPQSSHAGR